MKKSCTTALLLAAAWALPAAAETTECTNITSLPAVISSSGVYCMKQDLSTAMSTGQAISINSNNVVLDCNGFRLGGLAAGPSTQATGIHSTIRKNITVRDCNVRGFRTGLEFTHFGYAEHGGHVVEDSLFDSNTQIGFTLYGDRSVARRNRVLNTGGSTLLGDVIGVQASGKPVLVDDNYISGVTGSTDAAAETAGLKLTGYMSLARDNVVTDVRAGAGVSSGIHAGGTTITLERNYFFNVGGSPQYGVNTTYGSVLCFNNRVRSWTVSAYDECDNGGGNFPAIP